MLNRYKYVIVPLLALFICQFIKFCTESYKNKKLEWKRLLNGSGGMPSSHSTLIFSLAFMFLFNEGLDSDSFALSLVFGLIVAYDAMGVRMESGKQAKTINMLISELFNKDKGYDALKEQMGHKPAEVFWGIVLAVAVSSVFTFIIK